MIIIFYPYLLKSNCLRNSNCNNPLSGAGAPPLSATLERARYIDSSAQPRRQPFWLCEPFPLSGESSPQLWGSQGVMYNLARKFLLPGESKTMYAIRLLFYSGTIEFIIISSLISPFILLSSQSRSSPSIHTTTVNLIISPGLTFFIIPSATILFP